MPDSTAGLPYNQTITANGGTGAISLTYAITSGVIPAGLTFTISNNELTIAGTPTASGTVSFDVTAIDAIGAITQSYTLTINPAMPDHLVFLQLPMSTAAGQTITPAVIVAVVTGLSTLSAPTARIRLPSPSTTTPAVAPSAALSP